MPGSDREYDLVRVKDASSNSKADTFFVAPKHVGRDGAGTERMVLAETDEPPTPETGEQYLFLGTDGTLKAKFADGSVAGVGSESGAPDDAEYVTLASDPDLSAESLHQNLTGVQLHDPAVHSGTHESGGTDVLDAQALDNFSHVGTHQSGGADELDVTGLSGDLADAQDPKDHSDTHESGGSDPILPENLDGSTGLPNQVLVSDGTNLSFSTVPLDPINRTDRAETFTESDVTVQTTNAEVNRGRVRIIDNTYTITNLTQEDTLPVQDFEPFDIAWNDDGTKLYEAGTNGDRIIQFNLSTPFDLTTATVQSTFPTRADFPAGLAWNNTGSKMFIIQAGTDEIDEYTLSTPFDVTTASFQTSIPTQDDTPRSLTFDNTGGRMYEGGLNDGQVVQYTLSTPFDITTATVDSIIAANDSGPVGLEFNDDGTKLFQVGSFQGDISESTLSTPFEISTATETESVTPSFVTAPRGIAWDNTGTRLFYLENRGPLSETTVPPNPTSGSATVEWEPDPPEDIADWNRATYLRTLDGETVDVFIAFDDGSGYTRTNGGDPIPRGYDLGADANITPSDAVRFEVELSRADELAEPALDAVYRRWLV